MRYLAHDHDVGRGGELRERDGARARIEEVLSSARGGGGTVLGLIGEAGLGKTSLLEEAIERGRALGFRVALARGDSAESSLPFGLLHQAAVELGGADRFERLAAGTAGEAHARRFYATARWLDAQAASPLLLAIDDLHWADPDSLELIAFLCRRVAGLPVAFVVTLRPWPQQAADTLAALDGGGHARLETLAALSVEAGAAMLEELLGSPVAPGVAGRAWSLSAGNPLLLEQIAHGLRRGDGLPAGSSAAAREHLLLPRFAGMPAEALRYARSACVFGTRFRLGVMAAAADLGSGQADAALAALTQGGLIQTGGPGWGEFRHPMFRQAIYDDIPEPVRERLHARAFDALLAAAVAPAEIAPHATRAGLTGDPRAVDVLTRAGRDAMGAGATASGRTQLAAALELAGAGAEPRLLLSVAESRMVSGDLDGARELGDRVLAAPGAAPAMPVRAHWLLARTAFFGGGEAAAEEHFRAAGAAAGDDRELAVSVLLDAASVRWMTRGPAACLAVAGEARELAHGTALSDEAAAVWAQAALMAGDAGGLDALDSAAGLLERASPVDPPDFLFSGGPLLAYLYGVKVVERFDDALRAFAVSHAAAERAGSPLAIGLCLVTHADTLTRLGRPSEALDMLDRAVRVADFSVAVGPWAAIGRAHVLLEMGRLRESREQCAGVAALLAALPDRLPLLRLWLWRIEADLQLAGGDVEGSCAMVERIEDLGRRAGIVEPCVVPWHGLAIRANHAAGRFAELERHAAQLEALTRDMPCQAPRAVAATARALVAEQAGDRGTARAHFERALAHQSHAPMPIARAEILLAYGGFLRRAGGRREAGEILNDALQTAEQAGALRWRAAIQEELRVAGGRGRAERARVALTPQEERVVALVSEGLSNKEVAARLSITAKTVSNHLEHIYRKLGIHSRRELMKVARDPAAPADP
jgi:DNA-binding CsgD family transcriptional regulator